MGKAEVHQNRSINFPAILPLKKRRFPIIVEVDENINVSATPDKPLGNEIIEEVHVKGSLNDRPTNVDSQVVEEASLSGNDAAKDFGNKSRIINLCKTRSTILNELMIQPSRKKRYSDLDGETQPQTNREEDYKFTKDRNSRPKFMQRKWESETSFNYCRFRSKHASDMKIEYNNYDNNNNRRNTSNDGGCFRYELDNGREHSQPRVLGKRNSGRTEVEDGDEYYINNEETLQYRFHMNDDDVEYRPRVSYRFCPDSGFDGRIKPRRNRNNEDVEYRPRVECVWHDDDRGRRRRRF